jgi:hypothetical protein
MALGSASVTRYRPPADLPKSWAGTPSTGIRTIDAQTRKLEAEDAARLAAGRAQAEAERPTPVAANTRPGG